MSLRWRLTLWSSIVLTVFLAVIGVIAIVSVRYFLIQRVDDNLDRQTAASIQYGLLRHNQDLSQVGNEQRVDAVFYTILDDKGQIVRADRDVPVDPEKVGRTLDGETLTYQASLPDGGTVRVMLKPIKLLTPDGPIKGVLQAATPLAFLDQILNEMTILVLVSSLILLAIGAVGSYMLTGRAFRAVAQVTRKVNQIERSQDLSQRLPEAGGSDEVSTLVATFNRLLTRLQSAFETQRRFVADSSHELRTPLTVIKSNLHLLRQADSRADRAELLSVTEAEVSRLNHMVDDLLYMAQLQAGHDLKPILRPVELDSLLLDVFARARPLALLKHHKMALIHEDIAATMGDRDQLQHLLLNLLDNAVKYTRPEGTITLGLWSEQGWARIEVSDNGIGIAPEDMPLIFDRFFRTSEARQNQRNGSGLGLAIVKSIAQAHGGKVEVYSRQGTGTTFRVWLRLIDSPLTPTLDDEDDAQAALPPPPPTAEPTYVSAAPHSDPQV
jgi:two-component system OmpR family sensor kinase